MPMTDQERGVETGQRLAGPGLELLCSRRDLGSAGPLRDAVIFSLTRPSRRPGAGRSGSAAAAPRR